MHPSENLGVTPALKMPEWEVALSLAQGLRDAFFSCCLPKKSIGAGPGWDQSPKSNKASSGEEVILLLGILLCILDPEGLVCRDAQPRAAFLMVLLGMSPKTVLICTWAGWQKLVQRQHLASFEGLTCQKKRIFVWLLHYRN